ncbi:MAG: heme o synthase [Armatimonadota bacterium]|nr:heme o synthase [Armatimonadota bacterium]
MSSSGDTQSNRASAAIRRLSLVASVSTGVLLLVGATVSATGAGLACPDWPLCHGRLIPPLDPLVLIEWGHRLLASAIGLMMAALAVLVWRRGLRGLGRLMVTLLLLLAAQVGLGGATVLSRLVPFVIGTHLLTAMTFLALLVLFTARVWWADGAAQGALAPPAGLASAAHLALALTFLQVALGGYTSAFGAGMACPDFPLCRGRLFPGGDPLVMLHYAHRLVAFALAVTVAVVAARARLSRDRTVRVAAATAMLAVIVQVALGAANVLTHMWIPVRVAHLGGAATLVAALVVLTVRARLAVAAASAGASAAGPGGLRAVVADYVALTKPRIVVLLLLTTIAAMVVAAGGPVTWALAVYTLLGGALAAGAANAINCYWDRDIDAVMLRTRKRPIPARRIAPRRALAFGAALAAGSVLVLGLAVNWLSASLAFAGIAYYVVVYTMWLKRATAQNIVIGGAAGAIPPLVGWAAVRGDVDLAALVLFAIVFLWTPPHFWALALNRSEEYRAARIPMLPVVRGTGETVRQIGLYTLALIASTLLLGVLGVLGRLYLASAMVLAVPFIWLAARLARHTTSRAAWALFGYSILYLGLLFFSMALDRLLA